MIRPFTCICMLMAAGSGLYLYQTKHRAQLLDREIARTYKQIDLAKDRIGVLKGEWALVNEPDRLNELAQQHLSLKTLAPTQFVALADLPGRLPAPLPPGTAILPPADPVPTPAAIPMAAAKPAAPPTAPSAPKLLASNDRAPEKPATEKPAAEKPAAEKQVSPPAIAAAPRATPHATTPAVAVAAPAPAPATVLATAARPLPAPVPVAPAPVVTAQNTPQATAPRNTASHITAPVMTVSAASIPVGANHALAPGSIGESVARAAARNHAPVIVPATTTAQPAYNPATYPAQPIPSSAYSQGSYAPPSYSQGSLLGGAARVAMPAPVPFGATQAGR